MFTPQSEYYSDVTHDFSAVYKNCTVEFNMKSFHFHNVYELYYFITGERRLFYKDRIYHISPGDIALINKYEIHSVGDWEKPGYSMIMIAFKEEFLSEFLSDYNLFECFNRDIIVISPKDTAGERAYEKFSDILQEYNGSLNGRTAALKIKTAELLITLSRLQDIYGEKKETAESSHLMIEAIMKYIITNYENTITLQEIADFTGYTKNYICSYFKKYSGFSIIEYLNSYRVKKSQEYLKNTDMSITDISSVCGFKSITHFGRTFKLIVGCSPLQYKNRLKGAVVSK